VPEHSEISRYLRSSVIALGEMTVVSVAAGWLVAGRVLRPLRVMTATTRRISADNLHERLAFRGPGDELKDLADTVDALLGRLDGAFAAQRRFVANASHELRTPLATMRVSVDVAVARPGPVPPETITLASQVRTELDKVDELLEGLLVLARAQHGVLPGHAVLALDDVVSEALAAQAGAIAAGNLTVQHAESDGIWVEGSQPLLRRMADNVLGNAVSHNRDGGWIRIAATASDGTARLVVENGGDILDPAQVAEDARALAGRVAEGLRDQGMAVDIARDGLEAAAKLDINAYDVVLLDRDLPGISGDALCQMITSRDQRAMVLMLTAAGSPQDRVSGLGLGADDYLAKPFHFPELVLRIRALGRRQPSARARVLRAAGIELDPATRMATRDGRTLDLSVKEFAVLEALLHASPAFLSAEDLLETAWDENADPFTTTVTATISRLRRKLGEPPVITTTPGVGYRISGEAH
jgi:DNA-binding response OmpR family regulator/HAMP domain-containing protein